MTTRYSLESYLGYLLLGDAGECLIALNREGIQSVYLKPSRDRNLTFEHQPTILAKKMSGEEHKNSIFILKGFFMLFFFCCCLANLLSDNKNDVITLKNIESGKFAQTIEENLKICPLMS